MSNLLIVESPSKAKTIKKYLGSNFKVMASMGHVRDLPKSKLGIDVEHDFEPSYISIRGKGDLIKGLKKEAKLAKKVYLGTDPDREGEAISWHLSVLLGLDGTQPIRVTFNEITKQAVQNGVRNPRPLNMNLVDAQQARRIVDRLVGYKISPFLWRKVRKGLSAGRVQSVATRLIVDREDEIEAFVPVEYWTIDALLETGEGKKFSARFYGKGERKMSLDDKQATDDMLAQLKDALDHNFGQRVITGGASAAAEPSTQPRSCLDAAAAQASSAQLLDVVRAVLNGAAPSSAASGSTASYADIQSLLDSTPSYGNDNNDADYYAALVARLYCEEMAKYRNPRGGQFQAALFPVSSNVVYGYDVGALPDGRSAGRPLADGVSPRAGKDVHGPTAAANSVSKLDHALASNGTLYNVKFLPSALAGDKGILNLAALIRGYFDRKGMEMQFNVVDKATLLDAQAHPDQYQDLVVRVAGYSANFTKLAKDVQDDLISRTEQSF